MLRFVEWPFTSSSDLPPLELANRRWAEAYSLLRQEKALHLTRRSTWQEDLSAARSANDNLPAATHLLRLRSVEKQHRNSRQIRYVSGRLSFKKGLSMVVAPTNPDGSGVWRERSSKAELESACLQENDRRFN